MQTRNYACLLFVAFVGCSQGPAKTSQSPQKGQTKVNANKALIESPVAPSKDGEQFILAGEPQKPQTVIEVRKSAKNEDEVVFVGRIGGSKSPWIKGRAAFTVVDESLRSCDQIEGDDCKFPWDYCCATDKLKTSSTLVKVVGKDGKLVKTDARQLLGVRELTKVVIKGKVQRDDKAGTFSILATALFVKK